MAGSGLHSGRRRLQRWVGAALAGALAVGVLSSCQNNDNSRPLSQATGDQLGDEDFSYFSGMDSVVSRLTDALMAHDRKAFLGVFSGPAVAPATSWWTNQSALGFTVGAVAIETPKTSMVKPKNGVASLQVTASFATHNAADPTDDDGKPAIAGWRYTLTLQTDSRTAPPKVVAMAPTVGPAPWDGGALHVARANRVVVAGPASEAATIDRYAGYAKAAADWIFAFAQRNHQGLTNRKHGFVIFVTADKNLRNRWFHAASTKQQGWVPDAAGYEMPLAQPPLLYASDKVGHAVIGGERIVVAPNSDPHQAQTVLVHEMAHALIEEFGSGFAKSRPPLWTVEGWARWVETIFDTHRADGKGTFTGATANGVRAAVRSGFFTGTPPQDSVVYGGSAQDGQYAYDLGASGIQYLAETYGAGNAIKAIMYAYMEGGSAFSRVIAEDNSHGSVTSVTFADEATVTRAWAQWVRASYS